MSSNQSHSRSSNHSQVSVDHMEQNLGGQVTQDFLKKFHHPSP